MKSGALPGGALYFLAVFITGFALGALRILAVTPRIGALAAVILELPLMLAASWLFSRLIITRLKVPPDARLTMGGIAFVLLMTAETLLGMLAFARSPADQLAMLATPTGALGLFGQAAFAFIPWLQTRLA